MTTASARFRQATSPDDREIRQRGRWTVLVSGSPLGGESVRWDGDDLNAGLSRVLAELQERVPGLLD
ncbi:MULTISPECIES: hypothetical protein [Micromonospora]|uniref:Uncharacterized protein n=1 Tax=Micromonospora gifhornensis TaxID=84594 RepID=A0ABQ4II89_9ACTN|nr:MULTISPECIES: hypothetical protein [Micromonospora]GIJ17433.1 hypothetical protein Vgi01_41170 [Micromonospora gifhornensis]